MRVRPLRDAADVRALLVAHGRAWRAAYGELLPGAAIDRVAAEDPDEDRVAAEFERLSGYGEGRVLVAEDDAGAVRGYAVYRWNPADTRDSVRSGEAELKELYVDPDCWGRGYGTALLEAGLDRLPDHVDAVALETFEDNDVGIGFYDACGFEDAGTASFEVNGERYPTRTYRRQLE